jgi:hypothetical protein
MEIGKSRLFFSSQMRGFSLKSLLMGHFCMAAMRELGVAGYPFYGFCLLDRKQFSHHNLTFCGLPAYVLFGIS